MPEPEHLACGLCGETYPADQLQRTCPEDGRPLLARYDLDSVRDQVSPQTLEQGRPDLWRLAPVLPLEDAYHRVTLGEGATPLLDAPRIADAVGVETVLVKDEGVNPTGTFKARGLSMAVSRAIELGVERFTVPTAGNAGAALAAYAARAARPARLFVPQDAPASVFERAQAYGAEVEKVDGLITDAGERVAELVDREPDWWDLSTLKEPYRLEGKKTMGYELAIDGGWTLPDVVVYPTGGGTGLIGMWKAFEELEALGWIEPEDRPRMVSVQSAGCDPIVSAFEAGDRFAEQVEDAQTLAGGLRVPGAVGDFLILDAIRESDGTAVRVQDEAIVDARRRFPKLSGVSACTEAAATLTGLEALAEDGWLDPDDEVVLFNTGAAWTG